METCKRKENEKFNLFSFMLAKSLNYKPIILQKFYIKELHIFLQNIKNRALWEGKKFFTSIKVNFTLIDNF